MADPAPDPHAPLSRAIADYAIAQAALGNAPHGVVTKYVVVAEVLAPDGHRRALMQTSQQADGMKLVSWDELGMHFMAAIQAVFNNLPRR